MAVLDILHYPDPRLHYKAKPVEVSPISEAIRQLAHDMAETMYAAPGIGLAATQVNRQVRVVVMDLSEKGDQLLTLINPEITYKSDEKQTCEEGCLSIPGVYEKVERAQHIHFKAFDVEGRLYEMQVEGLMAVCVQHELDHLEGKVFIERLSPLKSTRIKTKLRKAEREAAQL